MGRPSELQPKLRLFRGRIRLFGPGKAELLREIEATGSIRSAAARMRMSYNRAWTLVRSMNAAFRGKVVTASRGGGAGGGAALTATGRKVLDCYSRMERACLEATRADRRALGELAAKR
jgi:molybdate transport system regulatory protein